MYLQVITASFSEKISYKQKNLILADGLNDPIAPVVVWVDVWITRRCQGLELESWYVKVSATRQDCKTEQSLVFIAETFQTTTRDVRLFLINGVNLTETCRYLWASFVHPF